MALARSCLFAALASAVASSAPASAKSDPQLLLAAKAALGRMEVRKKDTPGPGETTITRAVRLLELPHGPVLITELTIDGGSHAEVGALGVYYLKRAGNRYTVLKSWPEAVEGGGFGQAPEWSIATRFTKFPAIYATAGWTGQGCVSQWAVIAELAPAKPLVSDPIFISYSYDRPGTNEPETLNGRIANIRKGASFDVVATGTRRLTEHYAVRHGHYELTGKESALQC